MGCAATQNVNEELENIKKSVSMYKEAAKKLKQNQFAEGNEIIDECIHKLKNLLKLNSEWSEAREVLAWCLKEKGSWHEKTSDWFGSLADGFVYKPGPGWVKAEHPPSPEDVEKYRKIEKNEKEKVLPILREALKQLNLAAQIIGSSSPRSLALRAEIFLIMEKPVEAYNIYFHLSMDEKVPPDAQHKFRLLAEAIRRDPAYEKDLRERQRREYDPLNR
jgi:hypothetical protein